MSKQFAITLGCAIAAFLLGIAFVHLSAPDEPPLPLLIRIGKQLDARQYQWLEAETFRLGPGWQVGRLRDVESVAKTDGWIFPYEDYYCTPTTAADMAQSTCECAIDIPSAGRYVVWVRAARHADSAVDTLVLDLGPVKARIALAVSAPPKTPTFTWHRSDELTITEPANTLRMSDPDGLPTLVDCLLVTNDMDFVPEAKHRNPTRGEMTDSAWLDLGIATTWLDSIEVERHLPPGTTVDIDWRTRRSLDTGSPDDTEWAPLRLAPGVDVAQPSGPLHRFLQWRARLGTTDRSRTPTLDGMTLQRADVSAAGIGVDRFLNGKPARNRYPFRHESTGQAQLGELRERHDFAERMGELQTELERMACLRDWVKAQFATGTPSPYPPWNALVVLAWINSGWTAGFCAQYCQVFVQAALALGWSPRYVGVFDQAAGRGHVTVEIWSNQFNKWILMDPTYNVHFERRGVPLNALELHAAWLENATQSIDIAGGRHHFENDPYDEAKRDELFAYFSHFNIYLRNDHLSVPLTADEERAETQGRQVYSLNYIDQDTPPQKRFGAYQSSRVDDFYWPLNQVYVRVAGFSKDDLHLKLRHNMPNFSHYRVTVNGQSRSVPGSSLTVDLAQGTTRIDVAAMNVLAVCGPASVLTVSTR